MLQGWPMGQLPRVCLAQSRLAFSPGRWGSPKGLWESNGGCLTARLPPANAGKS